MTCIGRHRLESGDTVSVGGQTAVVDVVSATEFHANVKRAADDDHPAVLLLQRKSEAGLEYVSRHYPKPLVSVSF